MAGERYKVAFRRAQWEGGEGREESEGEGREKEGMCPLPPQS